MSQVTSTYFYFYLYNIKKSSTVKCEGCDSNLLKMKCSTRKVIELSVKSLLFLILLFLYYFFYMNNALSQYYEKRTTMAESIKPDNQHEYPVFIFCPEPGFKPSFSMKPLIKQDHQILINTYGK